MIEPAILAARLEARAALGFGQTRLALRLAALWLRSPEAGTVVRLAMSPSSLGRLAPIPTGDIVSRSTRYSDRDPLLVGEGARRPDGGPFPPSFVSPVSPLPAGRARGEIASGLSSSDHSANAADGGAEAGEESPGAI